MAFNFNGELVIDISDVQRGIDWDKAHAAGLWGAILKIGSGDDLTEQDSDYFESFVAECEKRGIYWGAYIYSYAMSTAEIPSEIAHMKRRLMGKRPTLPVYFDMEDADSYKVRHGGVPSRQAITDMVAQFCTGMEQAGYFAGWYCNKDWCDNHLFPEQLKRWTFWYARPGVDKPEGSPAMWQKGIGETGSTWPGVPGLCDTDICYENFPDEIKAAGLNNWGKPVTPPQKAPTVSTATPKPAPVKLHVNDMGRRGPNPSRVYSLKYDKQIYYLQGHLGIAQTGIADDRTYNTMHNAGDKYRVKSGAKSTYIMWVQQRLNSWGYNCGVADGVAGPQTMAGVAAFQKAYGLGVGDLYGGDFYYLIEM